MSSKFWVLRPSRDEHLLEWNQHEMDFDQVLCPLKEGHRRPGKRTTSLSVVLPRATVPDLAWTWQSELVVRSVVLSHLREDRITGYVAKKVKSRFKIPRADEPPQLWEIVVTGWAGLASAQAGLRVVESCDGCGYKRYTICDPTRLIDESQWDGSDFFLVWPLPKYIFLSDSCAQMLRARQFGGASIIPAEAIDISPGADLTPGRLSYWMPEDRARALGSKLGIV